MKKRQRRTVGAIVRIPLENEHHTYARILEHGLAFYDSRTKTDLPINEIVEKPVLFVTEVYDDAITDNHWQIIGKKKTIENSIVEHLKKPVYTEDVIAGNCTIFYSDGSQKTVAHHEVKGLELVAVWQYDNIEKRLNDFYAGRKNTFVEAMKNGKPISYNL